MRDLQLVPLKAYLKNSTQKELARKIGTQQQNIANWIKRRRNIFIDIGGKKLRKVEVIVCDESLSGQYMTIQAHGKRKPKTVINFQG